MEHTTEEKVKNNKKRYHKVVSDYSCECSVCSKQIRDRIVMPESVLFKEKKNFYEIGTRKRFTWVLAELGRQSLTHEIIIPTPDIVVFNKCRTLYLLQYQKDSIKYITSGDKLGLTEILKSYTKVVRSRKKEDKPGLKAAEVYGKEIALLRYTAKGKDNENLDECPEIEDGPLRVLSEKEFFDFMYERAGSPIWRNIVYIQTVVKCKTGFGEIITITYNTNETMDLAELSSALDTSKDDLIMQSDPTAYCKLICMRLDSLFHYNANLEILNMKAEFSKDDLGKIWFTHVTEFFVNSVKMPKKLSNEQGKLTNLEILALNAELDDRVPKCIGKPKYEEYSKEMNKIYQQIKYKTDADRVLQSIPISYVDVNLIEQLKTKHTWTKHTALTEKSEKKRESSFDPRNSNRAKLRFDMMKSYSKNKDFFPTNIIQRKEWIFTPASMSPEPKRNKSSLYLKVSNK
jgi:hypothetical protein